MLVRTQPSRQRKAADLKDLQFFRAWLSEFNMKLIFCPPGF
jgi:hypothetical protein